MKPWAIYARISTNLSKQNPESQLQELRRHAEFHKWTAVEFVEQKSGSLGEEGRPIFEGMMKRLRRGEFAGVLVWDLSRFSRSSQHLVECANEFRRLKIQFVSVKESIDTETTMGRLFFKIIAAIAEAERERTIERIKMGLSRAVAEGKTLGRHRHSVDIMALKEYRKAHSLRECEAHFKINKTTVSNLLRVAI